MKAETAEQRFIRMVMFKSLPETKLTKANIKAWYKKRLRGLEMRRDGNHPVLWRISHKDFVVYKRILNAQLEVLKREFNKRLEQKCQHQ